jgi:sorting nexin-1/2
VSTSTNKTIFQSKDFYVTRRFRDFAWLSQELSRTFPGIIVPPLPEKQTVGRFSSDFVESRQRGLERFLARVAANAEMGNSRVFVTFLEADDKTLGSMMNEVKASKPKLTSTAFKMFESTINTIQNSGKVSTLTSLCLTSLLIYD